MLFKYYSFLRGVPLTYIVALIYEVTVVDRENVAG